MKNKVIFIPKSEFEKWILSANLFAQSLFPPNAALKQFNSLNAQQRNEIEKAFAECDKIRKIKIPKGESDLVLSLSIMVDAHIIATEFDIDPLTAIMCIRPPCKANEIIFVK